jgi:hypothetical protein
MDRPNGSLNSDPMETVKAKWQMFFADAIAATKNGRRASRKLEEATVAPS